MSIKRILQIFHEIRYFKKIINIYGKSLVQGQYQLFPSMRAISANNPDTIAIATKYFGREIPQSKTTALISKINQSNYYNNRNRNTGRLFEAVYSANNYDKNREVKLFSFQRNEILTICVSPEVCNKQIDEYNLLHNCFNMPKIESYTSYKNAYIIAMVDLLPRPDDSLALQHICKSMASYKNAYIEAVKKIPVSEIASHAYDSDTITEKLNWLTEKLSPSLLSQNFPVCFQHGDLSRSNLMFGQCNGISDFWWIDWEHAKERIFIYDYFFYILNTAVYFNDKTALNEYLSGHYDIYLSNYFSTFDLSFDSTLRKDYFILFTISFLKERVCKYGNINALNNYCDFIANTVLDKENNYA